MKKAFSLILFSVIIIAIFSCRKIQQLPPEPSISYTNFKVFDTIDPLGNQEKGGMLSFSFEDGDGDLGMNPPAGEQADTNNLVIKLYRKVSGVMELVPDTAPDPLKPASYRIPFMEAKGQNKILKGTMTVTFLYLSYNADDTIQYEFWIKDRAQNESNHEMTNEIVISENNIY